MYTRYTHTYIYNNRLASYTVDELQQAASFTQLSEICIQELQLVHEEKQTRENMAELNERVSLLTNVIRGMCLYVFMYVCMNATKPNMAVLNERVSLLTSVI